MWREEWISPRTIFYTTKKRWNKKYSNFCVGLRDVLDCIRNDIHRRVGNPLFKFKLKRKKAAAMMVWSFMVNGYCSTHVEECRYNGNAVPIQRG